MAMKCADADTLIDCWHLTRRWSLDETRMCSTHISDKWEQLLELGTYDTYNHYKCIDTFMHYRIVVASGPCLEKFIVIFKDVNPCLQIVVSVCVWPCVSPTSVSMMRPIKKEKRLTPRRKSSLRCLRLNKVGCMSTIAVTRLSTHTNWWDRNDRKLHVTVLK